ncbi:hypothetical protein EDC04DRAFT_2701515 [Pisolithus marmoratus]|nr:hypothetical protein EDC04DRAFT_2701515 [Pisolithus marmoratus]
MYVGHERPRQSVANLIGRFEQQNKRQSLPSTPPPPRHLPSDSVKEAKDRKEGTPNPAIASVFTSPSPSTGQVKASPSSPEISPNSRGDVPASTSEPPKSPPSKDKPTAAGESTPKPVGTRVPSHRFTPHSQPLKPQHTGQSVASNTSLSRTPRPTPKSIPFTPSRPKTPAIQSRGTPRPKTPAAGPFAPTAASLARSRNTQPPVPPPVKQVASSSSVSERFTKPTAASLSKARTPVSVASTPSRVAKSTSTGDIPRASVKAKVVLSPAAAKDAKAKGVPKDKTLRSSEPPAGELAQGGRAGEPAVLSDTHDSVDVSQNGAHNEPVAERPPEDSRTVSELPCQLSDGSSLQDPNPDPPQPVQDNVENGRREDVSEEVDEEQRALIGPHEEDLPADASDQHTDIPAVPAIGHETEDTTNSLESLPVSKSRPQSMISIPDEHLDTSDGY